MDFFAKPITANPNATAETLVKKQVSWNHGLKGCYSEVSIKRISEGLKNSPAFQAAIADPAYKKKQSEITKNSEAVRIARLASRAKAEATKRLPGGYYDRRRAEALAKGRKPRVTVSRKTGAKLGRPAKPKQPKQPRQLQGEKGGKGLREGVAMGTPLMTPEGLFASRAEYIRFTGLTGASISQRIRKYPEHYFYLEV
jgi:hypothetical protein